MEINDVKIYLSFSSPKTELSAVNAVDNVKTKKRELK